MSNLSLNVDELNARWLQDFERSAWSYCESQYGCRPVTGIICTVTDPEPISDYGVVYQDEQALKIISQFKMPCSSDALIRRMALFSTSSISFDLETSPQTFGLKKKQIFQNLFCLQSLIQAAYPRNPLTGRFKPYDGADCAIKVDDAPPERAANCAFCGIGVLLMMEARKALDVLATDEMLAFELTSELFLGITDASI